MEKTKKCPYCGEEIHIEAQKCKHCGEWLDKENTTVNESLFNEEIECGNEEVIEDEEPFVEKGFFGYYWERIWRFHKFDTNGCVSRSEFWKYVLCCNVVCFFIMMTFLLVMSITGDYMKSGYIILMLISGALLLQYSITSICMAVRRLHDNDKSGWLLLLSFIPFLNIYLLYLLCKKGRTHDVDVPFKSRDTIQLVLIIALSIFFLVISKTIGNEFADETTKPVVESELTEGGDADTEISESYFDSENGLIGTFNFNGYMEDAANEYEVAMVLNFNDGTKADGYINYGDETNKNPVKATYSDGTIKVVEYDENGDPTGNDLTLNVDFEDASCSGYYSTFNGRGMSVKMIIGQ